MPRSNLSIDAMRKILQLRIRDVGTVKGYFPGAYNNTKCPMPGCVEKMTQYHIFYCNLIKPKEVMLDMISYEDLFKGNTNNQYTVMLIFFQRLKTVKRVQDQLQEQTIGSRGAVPVIREKEHL